MRILDINGQELTEEEADLSLGYLKEEQIVSEVIVEQSHPFVKRFYFTDNTSYTPTGEDDPHVRVMGEELGWFKYIPQEGEEPKKVRGMDIVTVIDVPGETVYEDILRYYLYTEEELIQKGLPQRVTDTEVNVEDLILLMAEVLGEEEVEPEPEEEVVEEVEPESEVVEGE